MPAIHHLTGPHSTAKSQGLRLLPPCSKRESEAQKKKGTPRPTPPPLINPHANQGPCHVLKADGWQERRDTAIHHTTTVQPTQVWVRTRPQCSLSGLWL